MEWFILPRLVHFTPLSPSLSLSHAHSIYPRRRVLTISHTLARCSFRHSSAKIFVKTHTHTHIHTIVRSADTPSDVNLTESFVFFYFPEGSERNESSTDTCLLPLLPAGRKSPLSPRDQEILFVRPTPPSPPRPGLFLSQLKQSSRVLAFARLLV